MDTNKLNAADNFQREIYAYIKDCHPHLLEDEETSQLIIDKANQAQETYSNAIAAGKPHHMAMEDANIVLYADLEFSPISYLQELYEGNKGEVLDNERAIDIYRQTKPIFDKYGKDIEGSENEFMLINELTPFLKNKQ